MIRSRRPFFHNGRRKRRSKAADAFSFFPIIDDLGGGVSLRKSNKPEFLKNDKSVALSTRCPEFP